MRRMSLLNERTVRVMQRLVHGQLHQPFAFRLTGGGPGILGSCGCDSADSAWPKRRTEKPSQHFRASRGILGYGLVETT